MARLPIYTQQTVVGAPQASMSAAAAPYGALADIGGSLADIGVQMKRREDVIDRVQKLGTFDTEAVQMLEAMQSTGDISTKETVDSFYQGLRARADELIESHNGTSQSRAELQAQLYNQVEQYNRTAMGEQIKAQKMMIASNVETKANELSVTATFAPGEVINALSEFDDHLLKIADSMSPQELEEYRKNGRAQIASGSINGFLQQGDLANARKLLKDTQIGTMLPPKESQRIALTISAEEGRRAAAATATTNNVTAWQSFLGRELSPQEAQRASQVNPFAKNKSIPEQIVELEMITGKPATQADIDRMLKRNQSEPGFGNSLQGRALDYVNSNAEAFAAGLLSPDEGRRFVASYNAAYGAKMVRDPMTGLFTEQAPSVPQFVQDSFESGQQYYGGVVSPKAGPQFEGTAQVGSSMADQTVPQTQAAQTGGSAAATAPATQAATQTAAQGQQPSVAERTLWSRRENLVGVGVGVESGVAGAPLGIGEAIVNPARAQQLRSDRQYATTITNNLVTALQNNPRYPEGERQAILKEVNIGPEVFTSMPAFEGKLLGINQVVTEREIRAREAMNTSISADARQGYMDAIPVLQDFRRQMGLPTYLPNVEALRKYPDMYPPGSQVIDSQGNIFIVPGGRQ